MGQLFSWTEYAKNNDVYSTPVEKLLCAKKVLSIREIPDGEAPFVPLGTYTVSRLTYKVYDNPVPDLRYYQAKNPVEDVAVQINIPNIFNDNEGIELTVYPGDGHQPYQKIFNPRYIYEVYAYPVSDELIKSVLRYEQPESQDAVIVSYNVGETLSRIKYLANDYAD
jgi:hypothetical protein